MTIPNLPQGTTPGTIPLLLGHPDPETLLTSELREAMQRVLTSAQAPAALQYGPERGARDLVTVLIEKTNREQGLALQLANLMLVAGSTHAVDMLARLYAGRGGVVLVEAPTYADSLHIFRDHQIELCAIPMDEEGMIPGELERQLAQIRERGSFASMLYTVPNFHNPTGRTLSEARRREIIRLARQENMLIVEDDVYHDLAFTGTVPSSLYALAGGQQVMSVGSFSKTLAPGLRLGWLVGPEEDIQRCLSCGTMQMGGGANPFTAQMVAEYCLSGAWEKHIERVRALYKTRRDLALSALEHYMPADVEWTRPAGGFFLWLRLPEKVFAREVKQLALAQGVAIAAGEGFFVNPADGAHHLRLAYSRATPAEINTGIRILAEVIRRLLES